MIILLIMEGFDWIFGQMADAICQYNPDISFIYCDAGLINRNLNEFKHLVGQADVVHWITNAAHAQPKEVVHWSLTNFPSIASLYHVAEDEKHKAETALLASCIHVMSGEWRTYLVDNLCVPASKIQTIPLGVDTSFFRFSPKNISLQKPFRIGCFGNPLAPGNRKGADILVEAFSMLDEGKYQLVLAGPNWEKILQGMKLSKIELNGFVDRRKLRKLYYSLDAYVIPSRVEGGPVTLLEAYSTGVPVISTPVGMSKDIIKHGENGFLIPKESPEALVNQIHSLHENLNSLENIKMKARFDVEKYDWELIGPLYGDLYREVFSGSSVKPKNQGGIIEFQGKKMLPEQQRMAVLVEKRYNKFASLMSQGNYLAGISEFANIPYQYWPRSILGGIRRIIRL